jgi:hypothetical protein
VGKHWDFLKREPFQLFGVEKHFFFPIDEFPSLAHIPSCVIWELSGHLARRMEWLRGPGMGITELTELKADPRLCAKMVKFLS